jgi:branched-subunit amino acid aminotransferase/4-amino-4-deoxychorismate lyase
VENSDASGSRLNNLSWMQVLKTQLTVKGKGYSDVLYLDAVENKYVEEVSSCNIFMVKVCAIARWCNWFYLHCN